MSRADRAKQFMPFDTLKGLQEALAEKEHIYVPKRKFSEEQREELDRKIQKIQKRDIITIEYFQQGEYLQITGMVSKLNFNKRLIKIINTEILFDNIADLLW